MAGFFVTILLLIEIVFFPHERCINSSHIVYPTTE